MRIWFLSKKMLRNSFFAAAIVALSALVLQKYGSYSVSMVESAAAYYKEAVFQGTTGGKNAAITINVDWGEEYIPEFLNILEKNHTEVTFFVTGTWAEKNPDLLRRMAQAGHSIQSHGYKHDHYNQMSVEQALEELKKAEKIISQITGKKCTAFASPYGEFDDNIIEAASRAGYPLIMWTVDSIDWKKPAPEVITERILSKIDKDAIILMHPTEPTLQALPDVLSGLHEKGYTCMTIEQILQPPVLESKEPAVPSFISQNQNMPSEI